MRPLPYLIFALSWLLVITASAEISITAIFNPPRIALGDRAQYVVEIKETDTQKQPEVERLTSLPLTQTGGLQLTNGRTSSSQQTSIVNGDAEYSVSQQLIIDAKAPHVGQFTIPGFSFVYKGETLRTPAATLTVVERSADAAPTTDELIFLKVDTPEQLYVGQTTRSLLKLYVSDSIRLTGLNSFDRIADGFTISELPDSKESTELYNGRRYRVLTWPLSITPIQTGQQDLNFQFTVSANMPGENNRRGPFGGSSLFDNFFGRTERFTVYTEPTKVTVMPLPETGKPESFTGAIGDFALEIYTDREKTQVGEPIMLSLEIAGTGNFDRIAGPEIPENSNWRIYDPESNFQPRGEDPQFGTKRFDYVTIPRQSGTLEIPEISFAYFDSKTKQYIELSTPPIAVEVSPSDRPSPAPSPSTPAATTTEIEARPLQKELSLEEALLTLDYRPKTTKRSSANPLKEAVFWLTHVAIGAALTGLCIWLRRQRRIKEDPAFAELLIAKKKCAESTKIARSAEDAATFFLAAQTTVRLRSTIRSSKNLRNANADELSTIMKNEGIDAEVIDAMRTLFAQADSLRFANAAQKMNLAKAKETLERILKAI